MFKVLTKNATLINESFSFLMFETSATLSTYSKEISSQTFHICNQNFVFTKRTAKYTQNSFNFVFICNCSWADYMSNKTFRERFFPHLRMTHD